MTVGGRSNLKLGSLDDSIDSGWGTGSANRCPSLCSTKVFFIFDLGGLVDSEMESLCFPKDCVFEASRNLKSFAGAVDETQPRPPSAQALAASLGQKDFIPPRNLKLTD
uniref:Uncharacterized protein n=1 Tax=Salix viminalis TaxID=40686 RepID=A0A6N2KE83_SALVM